MVWKIDNVPHSHYVVSGEPVAGVFEEWRVVQNLDGKTFIVKHGVNDEVNHSWLQKFSKESYSTVDQAVTALWKEVPMENAVYGIPSGQFAQLKKRHFPDYISRSIVEHEFNGKVCKAGDWCGFASVLTGDYSKGTSLIFEHIHFEII